LSPLPAEAQRAQANSPVPAKLAFPGSCADKRNTGAVGCARFDALLSGAADPLGSAQDGPTEAGVIKTRRKHERPQSEFALA